MPSRPPRCSRWHVFATVTIAVATRWLGGCSSGDSSETGTTSKAGGGPTTRANGGDKKGGNSKTESSADKTSKDAKPVAAPPMLAGWENPSAVIVVTGEQHG